MEKTKSSQVFLMGDQVEWEQVAPGVRRQIMGFDQKIMLVIVKFEKGGIGQLHEHYHSQVTYVESGVFELTVGDQKKTLRKGDSFYIPPHELHGCLCKEEGTLIDVFSPVREEFLKE